MSVKAIEICKNIRIEASKVEPNWAKIQGWAGEIWKLLDVEPSEFRQKVTCALLDCRSDKEQLKVALNLVHESCDIIDQQQAENKQQAVFLSLAKEEMDSLKTEIEEWRNKEGSVCPEDVGFAEYIKVLKSKDKRLKERIVKYGELLDGANHDVEQLTKYADDLKVENKQLKEEYNRGVKDGLNQAAEIIRKT